MYLAPERKERILQLLAERGSVRTVVLSKEMDVTDETVRNDLIELERNGLLKRVHGGAISLQKKAKNTSFMNNSEGDVDIAKAAAARVKSGMTIFLDGGAIGSLVASMLPQLPLTVVTNSPDIVTRLSGNSSIDAYCTGGLLDRKTGLLTGVGAAHSLSQLNMDMIFLSPDSCCPKRGLGFSSLPHAEFVLELISFGKKIIALCPSEKLEASATYYPVSAEKVEQVITNADAPDTPVNMQKV